MSERIIEQLTKARNAVRLPDERKAAVHMRLREVMDGHARAAAALGAHAMGPAAHPIRRFFSPLRAVRLAAIVLIAGSGGLSFAAAAALPGDALYGVKTQVNEPVRAAFAFTPAARAQVAAVHANERLEEAATLAAQGKLDARTEADLQAAFHTQAGIAESNIVLLQESGNTEEATQVTLRFEGLLRARQAALAASARHNNRERAVSREHGQDDQRPAVATYPQPAVTTTISAAAAAPADDDLSGAVQGKIDALTNLRSDIELKRRNKNREGRADDASRATTSSVPGADAQEPTPSRPGSNDEGRSGVAPGRDNNVLRTLGL